MHGEELIKRMRIKREATAVLKIKIASIKSRSADTFIFAIEGPEDKVVYFHWLRQVAPGLKHETLVCNGKGKLLDLRDLLRSDVSGLRQGVFFLVDHDFDGLRGQPQGTDAYVTETYAVENHLVTEDVFEQLLRVDLHCEGEPQAREMAQQVFRTLYGQFLAVTKPINNKIYAAKKVGVRGTKSWPDKIGMIADVTLERVNPVAEPDLVISLERELTPEEFAQHSSEFEALTPSKHYRGKFAIAFFSKLLKLLAEDRSSQTSKVFTTLRPQACNTGLQLDVIASKSTAPESFRIFLSSILVSSGNQTGSAT